MSSLAISNSSFSLTPMNSEAYQLDVQFLDANQQVLSKKSSIFTQQSTPESGVILDVYSQNGVCSNGLFANPEQALFQSKDEHGIKRAVKLLPSTEHAGPTVIVLDLKDPNKSYLDRDAIAARESAVCDFLSAEATADDVLPRAMKIHKIFKEALPLDFVLCEGSLKHALLANLSEDEAGYLLQRDPLAFCKYTEYFMNAFKLGQSTKDLTPVSFFKPVSKVGAFKPQATSTVWYPKQYKDIYSVNGTFFQTMKPVFSVSGKEAENISVVNVRMP